jgi:hypothetical protein
MTAGGIAAAMTVISAVTVTIVPAVIMPAIVAVTAPCPEREADGERRIRISIIVGIGIVGGIVIRC